MEKLDYKKVFVSRVRGLLDRDRISMLRLSNSLDVDYKTVRRWLDDSNALMPGLDNACALADYFGVPVGYLIGQEDKETDETKTRYFLRLYFDLCDKYGSRLLLENLVQLSRAYDLFRNDDYKNAVISRLIDSFFVPDPFAGIADDLPENQ